MISETSTKIKPIAPEIAKQFLEDYYHKLALRTEMRLTDDSAGRRSRGSKSKAKRRCVSFNQTDLQRNKTKGMSCELGRETCTHIRRMSVDVGLFLGQKGLQVKSGGSPRGSLEHSPTQGTITKEIADSNNMGVSEKEKGESRVEEKATKHGGKKKGSKKLKRSFRLGSTEEEDVSESSSQIQLSPPSSQIPGSKNRQGWFRSSLRKITSEETAGIVDSGSMVSIVEIKEKPGSSGGGGGGGKKNKFGATFPRRQWSWKLKKTENEIETLSQESEQCSVKEEGGVCFENPVEDILTSPTSLAQTGDSWSGYTPNKAWRTYTNKPVTGNHTHNQSFTKHTSL